MATTTQNQEQFPQAIGVGDGKLTSVMFCPGGTFTAAEVDEARKLLEGILCPTTSQYLHVACVAMKQVRARNT